MQKCNLQATWNFHISAVIMSLIVNIIRKIAEERMQNKLWQSYFTENS